MHRSQPSHPDEQHAVTTLLESFDSWAELIRHGEAKAAPSIPAAKIAAASSSASASPIASASIPGEADAYRPTLRRPLALLHVIDDGRDEGQTIRLRGDRVAIGRTEGDVTIPHDISMSARHAVLECLGGGAWRLTDAGSVCGTFVRVLAARLHAGSRLQLGASRFRFDHDEGAAATLVELLPDGDGARHPCRLPLTTIGRVGGGCHVSIADRFISPVHAELRLTSGGWRIENRGLNGLWVRADGPVTLTVPSQFQCGEQRFVFVPLGE